eukprot:1121285-Rhodomonas_salina.2
MEIKQDEYIPHDLWHYAVSLLLLAAMSPQPRPAPHATLTTSHNSTQDPADPAAPPYRSARRLTQGACTTASSTLRTTSSAGRHRCQVSLASTGSVGSLQADARLELVPAARSRLLHPHTPIKPAHAHARESRAVFSPCSLFSRAL